jgi:hypothetical protein
VIITNIGVRSVPFEDEGGLGHTATSFDLELYREVLDTENVRSRGCLFEQLRGQPHTKP